MSARGLSARGLSARGLSARDRTSLPSFDDFLWLLTLINWAVGLSEKEDAGARLALDHNLRGRG